MTHIMQKFIHFRVQSSYSMLESALTVDQIVHKAKEYGMPAICLADRGNMFGSLEFAISACKSGIQPIHGLIVNILYENNASAEVLLIAKDPIGYQNLLHIASNTNIDFDGLATHQEGLILLSGYTKGPIGKLLLQKRIQDAKDYTLKLSELFQDRFYLEIMRHNLAEEKVIEHQYIEIANQMQIPLIATNNVLFEDANMHDAHDVLLCISQGVTKENSNRFKVSNQCYFKSETEMIELFQDLKGAIQNTIYLAQRCYVCAQVQDPLLPKFSEDDADDDTELLKQEARNGLHQRLAAQHLQNESTLALYQQRLEYELNIICSMNFAGYFLIVSDFIKWSKKNGIPVGPGRGSGAGSVVAWSLLITDLDPIEFGLLFERFLNPERISMPDFDIDFCQARREEVIQYVRNKYGHNKVGQIITFGKMQAKAVIKDVGRVLDLPYKYANYLTELVPFNAVNPVTLSKAIKEVGELNSAFKGNGLYNLKGEEELIKQVLETSLVLEGLHRHASIHAAGIVISSHDLIEVVPICKDDASDMIIVQYSMKYAELAGLVKFDFLGLQTLTLISKCKELILSNQGIDINIDTLDFKDIKTYEMLSKGHSTGVFQFESVGMKDALRRLKPDCIGDLIALGALYRPGPMDNIPTYVACKHQKQKPNYLHPLLEEILKETYGVIVYQEQVLQIAQILAGYSLGSADLLRRAMGKKIKSEMDAQRIMFLDGAKKQRIASEQAESIFDTVAKFAGYGFNKAHGAAYGVISYQTAYLKANFPIEFLVAFLNLEINNSDKISIFIQEAKNQEIQIITPDINTSCAYFKIDNGKIIYSLGAIKNVAINFGSVVEQERTEHGPFTDIINFIERISHHVLNKRSLESLIKAGCFDLLHGITHRNTLLANINKIIDYGASYHHEQSSAQYSLITVNNTANQLLMELSNSSDPVKEEEIAFDEFEVLGLFIKNHPLMHDQKILEILNIKTSADLQFLNNGSTHIKIAGIIQKKDARMSVHGRFVSLQLSDSFNNFELTIFKEEILKEYVHLLEIKQIVVAYCDVFKDEGGVKLTAKSFKSINDEIMYGKFNLTLKTDNDESIEHIVKILQSCFNSNAHAKVAFFIKTKNGFTAKINIPGSFGFTKEYLRYLYNFHYIGMHSLGL